MPIYGRRHVSVHAGTMLFLRYRVMYLRRLLMATRDNGGRRRNARQRIRIKCRNVNRNGIMQQRSRLINPALMFLRVSINTSNTLSNARRNNACNASLTIRIFDVIRGPCNFLIRGRLLKIYLILNRIFRVGITRIARTNVRNSMNGIGALSFRALRRLTTRIRTNNEHHGDSFITYGGELRAFNVIQLCKAISSAIKRQHFTRHVRHLLRLVIQAIMGRAGHAPAQDNIISGLDRREIIIARMRLVTSACFANEVRRCVPRPRLFIRLARRRRFGAHANLFLIAMRTNERGLNIIRSGRVFIVGVIRGVLRRLILGLAHLAIRRRRA